MIATEYKDTHRVEILYKAEVDLGPLKNGTSKTWMSKLVELEQWANSLPDYELGLVDDGHGLGDWHLKATGLGPGVILGWLQIVTGKPWTWYSHGQYVQGSSLIWAPCHNIETRDEIWERAVESHEKTGIPIGLQVSFGRNLFSTPHRWLDVREFAQQLAWVKERRPSVKYLINWTAEAGNHLTKAAEPRLSKQEINDWVDLVDSIIG